MRALRVLSLGLGLTAGIAAQRSATLSHRAMPDFDLLLPDEVWVRATTGFALPHRGGEEFAASAHGLTLEVDTDGDGRLDETFKGLAHHVVLRARRADGKAVEYALRARTNGHTDTFAYACGGAMVGSLEGVPVQVVDQNCDGVFNEVGVDAIVTGPGNAASFLSRVVNLGGRLFELELDAAGTTAMTTPYHGPSGQLDVRSGLRVVGTLATAVVSDLAGKWSFEVGAGTRAVRVPAGVYVFSGGLAIKGDQEGKLRAGNMRPLVVADGGTTMLEWGAPLRAEFTASRVGDQVTIGRTVRYFGRAGEEWIPPRAFDRVPQLDVFDATKRTESQPLETC